MPISHVPNKATLASLLQPLFERHEKTFCVIICENKGADQLLCFCNIDSTIPLFP